MGEQQKIIAEVNARGMRPEAFGFALRQSDDEYPLYDRLNDRQMDEQLAIMRTYDGHRFEAKVEGDITDLPALLRYKDVAAELASLKAQMTGMVSLETVSAVFRRFYPYAQVWFMRELRTEATKRSAGSVEPGQTKAEGGAKE
ncbi:MAG TPA: hypothetical protein VGK74_02385 [Symbiobacteriaceae bacterium]|jgi:hypothetical protein